MSTATAPAAVERPLPAPGDSSAIRVFLARYGATLLPLLTALVALQLGWQMVTGSTWTAAVTAGWALAVAAWLRCRGWHVGTVLTVTGAPAVLMVALAGPGLSPAGLVLGGAGDHRAGRGAGDGRPARRRQPRHSRARPRSGPDHSAVLVAGPTRLGIRRRCRSGVTDLRTRTRRSCTNDRGPTLCAPGLCRAVAGAGFEPATSGL